MLAELAENRVSGSGVVENGGAEAESGAEGCGALSGNHINRFERSHAALVASLLITRCGFIGVWTFCQGPRIGVPSGDKRGAT